VEVVAVGGPKGVVVVGQRREEREVAEDQEEGEDQVMEEAVQKGEEAVMANQKGEEAVMEDPKEEGVVIVMVGLVIKQEEGVDINPKVTDIDIHIGIDIPIARDMMMIGHNIDPMNFYFCFVIAYFVLISVVF
jgi:hypothetical protein